MKDFVPNAEANKQINLINNLVKQGKKDALIAQLLNRKKIKHLRNQNGKWTPTDIADIKKKFHLGAIQGNNRKKPEERSSKSEQLNITIKRVTASVFAVLVFALVFSSVSRSPSSTRPHPTKFDFSYKETQNHNGVKFFYFKSNSAPPLEPTNNFSGLNNAQLNRILTSIPGIPELPETQSFRKGGKHIFTTDLDQGGDVSVHIRECRSNNKAYYCIKKILHSPSAKEMARTKAHKMPGKYAFVSEDQYGSEWPYTFEYGLLACKRYRDVVIVANHKVYAVNGKAMGTGIYQDAWSVRKPTYGGRMPPPSGFIQKGLALCKK